MKYTLLFGRRSNGKPPRGAEISKKNTRQNYFECAPRHPSLRKVVGLRGPTSFVAVVTITLTVGDARIAG